MQDQTDQNNTEPKNEEVKTEPGFGYDDFMSGQEPSPQPVTAPTGSEQSETAKETIVTSDQSVVDNGNAMNQPVKQQGQESVAPQPIENKPVEHVEQPSKDNVSVAASQSQEDEMASDVQSDEHVASPQGEERIEMPKKEMPEDLSSEALGFRVSDEQFETLIKKYCKDLTGRARAGKTPNIVGRSDEVDQLTTILLQKGRSNACLLGGAGVGKTAVFLALANHIVQDEDKIPEYFIGSRVLEIEFSLVSAGAADKGEFLGRLLPLIEGASERNESGYFPPIIFCIDEIHSCFMSSMSAEGSNNAAAGVGDIMKPYLTTGNMRIVGATTLDEFNLYIKPDPAMERRFQKVFLREPNKDETFIVLQGILPSYKKHFGIDVPDQALRRIIDLTVEFLRNRNNPDKSIMVLDGACARSVKANSSKITMEAIAQTIAAETGLDAKAFM